MFENGYERVSDINVMKKYFAKRYKLKAFEVDRASGFVTLTFDTSEKYIDIVGECHTESIKNPEQINYYLEEKFDCIVLDVGIKKSKTKNGYKNHIYIVFLHNDKFKVPKKIWMSGDRKNR